MVCEYYLAKYLRLSLDDAITESMSIQQQRRMLDKYIDELDIPGAVVLEFVDNGYTGTNIERPAFQEMLGLVQGGRINCILCKDFSRFGRNAIENGYFIDQVFPLYQTRFIAVDDDYDSDDYKEDTGGINIAFKHLMHEYYSKDLSQKVKSAKRIQMQRGENVVANAIYGYRKGESGRWEIDAEPAEVVRRVYGQAMGGLAPAKIRDGLFADGVPTPREYQTMKRGDDITPTCMWTARMVTHTLSNEQYTGMYVSGKQTSKGVGSHSKNHTDRSEWIMIPDRHPAIISKDMFNDVQVKMEKYRKAKAVRKPREYLLRGKVVCGCCDYALSYDAISDPVFRCHHTQANPAAECHKMKVNVRQLDEMVMGTIEKQLQVVLGSGLSDVRVVGNYGRQEEDCRKMISEATAERRRYYEGFVDGKTSREAFLEQKKRCGAQIEKLGQQLAALKSMQDSEKTRHLAVAAARKLVGEPVSPRELVEELVKKVRVFPHNRVEIEWLIADFGHCIGQ